MNLPVRYRARPIAHRPSRHQRIVPTKHGMRRVIVNPFIAKQHPQPITRRRAPMVPRHEYLKDPRHMIDELLKESAFAQHLFLEIDRNEQLLRREIRRAWNDFIERRDKMDIPVLDAKWAKENFNSWLREFIQDGDFFELYKDGKDQIHATIYHHKDYQLDDLVAEFAGTDNAAGVTTTFFDPWKGKLVNAPKNDGREPNGLNEKYWHAVQHFNYHVFPEDIEYEINKPADKMHDPTRLALALDKLKIPHVVINATYDSAIAVPKKFADQVKQLESAK
jgi:hypothetical protein